MATPITTSVCIVGAGPGGTSASIQLSNLGIPHLLVDKASFPRDKICGDACSGKVVDALKALDVKHYTNATQLPSYGVTFVAPNGNALRAPFKPNASTNEAAPGFIAKRIDFDSLMLEKALAHPQVTFESGIGLRSYTFIDGKWHCYDKNKELQIISDFLIVADGAQSAFARQVANIQQEDKHFAAGIRAYYKGIRDLDEENYIELHFLEQFIPGYFWIFPLPNGEANVGIGLRSDLLKKRKLDLKKVLFELIENHPKLKERFKDATLIDKVRGFGLPFGSKKRKLSGNNYVLVGDAGSLIDPFTGEGIGNAMISGIEAGKAIASKINNSDFDLSKYDVEVYNQLGQELNLSTKLQQLANQKWLFNRLINKATTNKALSTMISNMFMDLDIREELKKPSFYFKLLFN